mmetsp:Transcript_137449/g.439100  ORF Transcript_137449/g.439100 Transcript_137449/m.439100 type:complete len:254 (-) Transcript_137449:144-905(-)
MQNQAKQASTVIPVVVTVPMNSPSPSGEFCFTPGIAALSFVEPTFRASVSAAAAAALALARAAALASAAALALAAPAEEPAAEEAGGEPAAGEAAGEPPAGEAAGSAAPRELPPASMWTLRRQAASSAACLRLPKPILSSTSGAWPGGRSTGSAPSLRSFCSTAVSSAARLLSASRLWVTSSSACCAKIPQVGPFQGQGQMQLQAFSAAESRPITAAAVGKQWPPFSQASGQDLLREARVPNALSAKMRSRNI